MASVLGNPQVVNSGSEAVAGMKEAVEGEREQTCSNCRAFKVNRTTAFTGECHRRAAVGVDDGSGGLTGLWPTIYSDEFCCEWLPNEAPR